MPLINSFAVFFLLSLTKQTLATDKYISGNNHDKGAALEFLQRNDAEATLECKKAMLAVWNYTTNLTQENKQAMLDALNEDAKFWKAAWQNATSFAWKDFKKSNPLIYEWFKSLSNLGDAALPDEKYEELQELIANMTEIYSTAKVCYRSPCTKPTLELDPDIVGIMSNSVDFDVLLGVWARWRDATGKKLKPSFLRYVDLKNEAARRSGFADAGEVWRSAFGSNTFQEDIEDLWNRVKPFYMQLHAYTRKQLYRYYPDKMKLNGPIPAHLFGDLWSMSWTALYPILQPYDQERSLNVTQRMNVKAITPLQLFKISEQFYTSLGLLPTTPEFWNYSIFVKPTDRDVLCHPSAWDFCDGRDVRITMCAEVSMDNLIAVHHEMGHIQYYLQYAGQPYVFRDGANPGFHEAVGDALALSVSTPTYLNKIGFLDHVEVGSEEDINFLMYMALDKVAFLPFGYILDLWRWRVFSGNISRSELNSKWWEITQKYQGICPSVKRTEDDLDAVTIMHVIADVPYIRYFVSSIIQFQFHKALCKESGYSGPLHKCDIYGSKKAGKLLSDMLSKGCSITWNEAMLILTKGETDQMDVSGILEYFAPLITWLERQNTDEKLGWTNDDLTICS